MAPRPRVPARPTAPLLGPRAAAVASGGDPAGLGCAAVRPDGPPDAPDLSGSVAPHLDVAQRVETHPQSYVPSRRLGLGLGLELGFRVRTSSRAASPEVVREKA